MLQHVYEQVASSGLFHDVVIATEDERIYADAQKWFAKVVMTSDQHLTGTDRCAEVVDKFSLNNNEIVVNIQGDEPFISKEPLKQLLDIFDRNYDAGIATLVQQISEENEIKNTNMVKVVKDINGKALYFSRLPIPHIRESEKILPTEINYWKHIGLYAFKAEVLREISKLETGMLEKAESLEQLRWLENGYNIYTAETTYKMLSVDTHEDLQKAEEFYLSQQS
jgi:3-deoxy-manno-octulosonate cytidylyltransferase (CMP-KDO synthetase)